MTDNLQADRLEMSVVDKLNVMLDVHIHKTIDSTNSWCLQQSKAGRVLPFACFAEAQTAGRGRRGKPWLMSAHSDIALSLAWSFVMSEQLLHLLPLSVALAIVETLEGLGMGDVQVKWPNDVYVQGKKIAGILIETQPVKNSGLSKAGIDAGHVAVVVGLGLNYEVSVSDRLAMGESLELTDISEQVKLQRIAARPGRNAIASELLCNVVAVCMNFAQASKENLQKFRSGYDYCKQKKVDIILDNDERLSGVAQGVNDDAELIVLIDGAKRTFNSADVSVRADKIF